MAEVSRVAIAAKASQSVTHRMILASQKLSEPARALFDRVYLRGEAETNVKAAMGLTDAEFDTHNSNMLRALMIASQ